MLIEFSYKLPEGLVALMNKEIVNFNDDYITGWLDQADAGQLKHCAMYMVCTLEVHDDLNVMKNPIAIVARNENRAMDTYYKATSKNDGMVFCSIIDNCSKAKVSPTGRMI